MINDVASIILWLIVAVFFLHVIEGDAKAWVNSKFKVADPNAGGNISFTPAEVAAAAQATATNNNIAKPAPGVPGNGFNTAR